MYSATFLFFVLAFASVNCDRHLNAPVNPPLAEIVEDIAEEVRQSLDLVAGNVSETFSNISDVVIEQGGRIKEAMDDILNGDYYNAGGPVTTEFTGIDSTGCNRGMRKSLEEKCDLEYDRVNEEAQQIEDEREKIEAVCCALEDFEKCSLRAYDKASCITDKAAIRENLKAARLFLSVVANITCSEFRGQCAYYSSGSSKSGKNFKALIAAAVAVAIVVV